MMAIVVGWSLRDEYWRCFAAAVVMRVAAVHCAPTLNNDDMIAVLLQPLPRLRGMHYYCDRSNDVHVALKSRQLFLNFDFLDGWKDSFEFAPL